MLCAVVATGVFAAALPLGSIPAEASAAAAIVVWWTVLIGALAGGISRAPRPPRLALGAAAALLALVLLTAASVTWSPDAGRAYVEVVRWSLYLGVFLLGVGALRQGDGPAVLRGIALGLAAVLLLALGARLLPQLLTGDQTRLEAFPGVSGRLGYPIAYWNGLAAVAALGLIALAWSGATSRPLAGRAASIGAMPAALLVLYFTGSRGGVMALAIGLGALIALSAPRPRLLGGLALGIAGGMVLVVLAGQSTPLVEGRGDSEAQTAGLAVLVATILVSSAVAGVRVRLDARLAGMRVTRPVARAGIALVVVTIVATALSADLGGRIDAFSEPQVETRAGDAVSGRFLAPEANGRVQLWYAAAAAFLENPIQGLGSAGFATWWNQNGSVAVPTRHAHSVFLERFAELGLIGGLAILCLFGAGFHAIWTRTFGDFDGALAGAGALLAAGTASAAIEWTGAIPGAFTPVLLALALLTGAATARGRSHTAGGDLRRDSAVARLSPLLAAGLAIAAIAAASLLWASERAIERSRELAGQERYAEAAAAAGEAATLLPFAAAPLIQLSQVQRLAGDLDGAQETMLEAIERAPEDPRYYFLLAMLKSSRGDPTAPQSFITAIRLAPGGEESLRDADP